MMKRYILAKYVTKCNIGLNSGDFEESCVFFCSKTHNCIGMHRIALILALVVGLADAGAGPAYPAKPLTYTVAFGPGGGNDLMSRTAVDIIRQYGIYGGQPIRVENRPGGSGAIGYGRVARQAGNAYVITSTSGSFLTTPIVSETDWTYRDFTPVALLALDAMFLVVRSDSPFVSIDEFVARAKQADMKIGGNGATGPDRVVAGLFAEAAGIEFTYVPFQNGSGLLTGLTSSSLHALISNPSEVMGQVAAGNFRVLAYSAQVRSTVYPEVPTFVEQGYPVEFAVPRGVVMPGGVPDAVRDWWIAALRQVVASPEWKHYLESRGLSAAVLWGEDFGRYLGRTDSEYRRILNSFGSIH